MEDFNSIKNKLLNLIDFDFLDKITLSNNIKKGEGICFKAVFSNTLIKGQKGIQVSYYVDNKVVHENIKNEKELVIDKVLELMTENFKQCNIVSNRNITILMNRKKEFKITQNKENTAVTNKCKSVSHNSEKNYILKDGVYADWLFEVGLIDKNGNVHNSMQKKFRQINRFIEMVADIEKYVPDDALIVDMGCGKSYLTFAIYYYFNVIKNKNVKIKGFDLKKDVVEKCNKIAVKSGFDRLQFFADDIANLDTSEEKVSMIITLHACDIATDIALSHAVKWGCRVIMSVPCCQHELFYQVKNDVMKNVLDYGILKERFSALLTDGIRAETLKLCGYKTSVLEFIDMEHTPKNIMIRAVKKDGFKPKEQDILGYKRLLSEFNVEPMIYKLLKDKI